MANSASFARPASALARHRPHQLCEIPEVSVSSRASLFRRHSLNWVKGTDGLVEEKNEKHPEVQKDSTVANEPQIPSELPEITHSFPGRPLSPHSDRRSLTPSAFSIPLHEIPQRRSSISVLNQAVPQASQTGPHGLRIESRCSAVHNIPQSKTNSPVKDALDKGSQSRDMLSPSPSRTFVRTTTPFHLLDHDNSRHSRVDISLHLPSPLFVGGGTIEGQLEVKIDATSSKKVRMKPLYISRLSVDVIGIEQVDDGRRRIFLSLATELFDDQHAPPSSMVFSQKPENGPELFWQMKPGTSTIPFSIHLPLKVGPPPYVSRQANIRYLLCPSATLKVAEKRFAVRQAWNIQMLSVHDPEKALASLPSPLLATDTLVLDYVPIMQSIKLTAGLHRQTWVAGSVIFTDIHVANSTNKILKRIELQLEKCVLWFSHSAAGTTEKKASNLRLPSKIDSNVVHKTVIKGDHDWKGVMPQASEVRTCELEIPKGHATVGDGRFFEVRYFVKVSVVAGRNKTVSVQLPVSIIHMNSLDIMPNSIAQVAASIEAKRSMAIAAIGNSISRLPHSQGQAFSATRRQSSHPSQHQVNGMTAEDVNTLTFELDNSPRRMDGAAAAESNRTSVVQSPPIRERTRTGPASCPRHPVSCTTCYHCHLLHAEYATKMAQQRGPKLPRLQVSTSGLGFSESEFEIPPDSPRKVMLSEKERQMINQQRELKAQRDWTQRKEQYMAHDEEEKGPQPPFIGWRNIAINADKRPVWSAMPPIGQQPAQRQLSHRRNGVKRTHPKSLPSSAPIRGRSRSRTHPQTSRASFGDSSDQRLLRPSRSMRSLDQKENVPPASFRTTDDDVFGPTRQTSRRLNRKALTIQTQNIGA